LISKKRVGVFLIEAALGYSESFPHAVASVLLKVKHVPLFHMEQWMKFMAWWDSKELDSVFDGLYMHLFLL
jgi:hypothetical protein